MKYRRFGRTQLQMPVFSCGGMRYQHKWQDIPPDEVPPDGQANLEATIHRALELGINHIETARGYGSSEMQLGYVLPRLPREKLIVQTKVGPSPSPATFRETFDKSLRYLQLEYVDLLAFHGVNTSEILDQVLRPGGCLEAARKLQKEGRVRFVGFSTHAPLSVIMRAVESGEFDYINLHWYFVNPLNWPAIVAATERDMGVFIISPTDKGGMLYRPPAKLTELCRPLSPIAFNDLYCLARPEVHTLSIGAARPSDFDEHVQALEHYSHIGETLRPVEERIRAEMARCVGEEWLRGWWRGLPEYPDAPNEVNLPEILRLWTYATSLDLTEYGRARYNLLGSGDHWTPGNHAASVTEAEIAPALEKSPFADRIPAILQEAHEILGGEARKRLSNS